MPASQETSWRKKKRTPQPNLSMIPEGNELSPNAHITIAEMYVDGNVREDVRFDYYTYPDADEHAAFGALTNMICWRRNTETPFSSCY
jgi:hypothetical protein